jgi:hypothetical protein
LCISRTDKKGVISDEGNVRRGNFVTYRSRFSHLKTIAMSVAVERKENVKKAVPFFFVINMESSLRFYVEGLGFTMEGKLRWCWLQLGEAAIMLQEFKNDHDNSGLPKSRLGEGVTIYFICEDAIAIYRELVSRGVEATKPFVGNGMWVTGCTDPNGYKLEFESLTNAPEETVFAEP